MHTFRRSLLVTEIVVWRMKKSRKRKEFERRSNAALFLTSTQLANYGVKWASLFNYPFKSVQTYGAFSGNDLCKRKKSTHTQLMLLDTLKGKKTRQFKPFFYNTNKSRWRETNKANFICFDMQIHYITLELACAPVEQNNVYFRSSSQVAFSDSFIWIRPADE